MMGRATPRATPSAADAEAELVLRAVDGDEAAVVALYRTYAGALYGFGLRRLGDPGLAEELVQTVLTRVWTSARRYDAARGSVRTWVFTMARTVAIDLYRRQPPASTPVTDVAAVDDELEELVLAEAVRAALDRLSPEHREVIELAYYRGLTQHEIAQRCGLPRGTVKSRTFYALKAFRLACDELGVEP